MTPLGFPPTTCRLRAGGLEPEPARDLDALSDEDMPGGDLENWLYEMTAELLEEAGMASAPAAETSAL